MSLTLFVGRVYQQLKVRRVDQDVGSVVKSYGVYPERQSNAFDSRALSLNFMKNIVLDGFFQSWRYVSARAGSGSGSGSVVTATAAL